MNSSGRKGHRPKPNNDRDPHNSFSDRVSAPDRQRLCGQRRKQRPPLRPRGLCVPVTLPPVKPIQPQVSPPDERSCGIVIEGAYAVCGDQLHVRDHEDRSWTIALKPGDNAEVLARKCCARDSGSTTHSISPFTTLLAAIIRACSHKLPCRVLIFLHSRLGTNAAA
jgi:hypothetical protein